MFSPYGIPVDEARFQPAIDDALEEAKQWQEVSLELDSILDGAGRLRGKDSGDCFRLFSEWLQADRDLADGLLSLRDAADIAQALQPGTIGGSTSFERRDHYGRRRAQRVQHLRRLLQAEGPDAVFAAADRLRARSRSRVVFR